MNKSEVSELKKRFTKNKCTFTKMCGCYVNAEKNRIVDINESTENTFGTRREPVLERKHENGGFLAGQ